MPDYKHEFKILTKITAGSVFPEKGYKGFEIKLTVRFRKYNIVFETVASFKVKINNIS